MAKNVRNNIDYVRIFEPRCLKLRLLKLDLCIENVSILNRTKWQIFQGLFYNENFQ